MAKTKKSNEIAFPVVILPYGDIHTHLWLLPNEGDRILPVAAKGNKHLLEARGPALVVHTKTFEGDALHHEDVREAPLDDKAIWDWIDRTMNKGIKVKDRPKSSMEQAWDNNVAEKKAALEG